MFKEKNLMFIIAETPMHVGSGSEVGIVDLPIQREQYTRFPKIEGSSLKGALREFFESQNNSSKDQIDIIFGPENGEDYAGAISVSDARILFFPVKSLKNVFAWITCPLVLNRFLNDLNLVGKKLNFNFRENSVSNNCDLLLENDYIVLEEYTFKISKDNQVDEFISEIVNKIFPDTNYKYWKEKLKKDLVILSDDDFYQFIESSTEVITRTKIDSEKGTVQSGALWTEEYLPADTIMYSLIFFTDGKNIKTDENNQKQAKDLHNSFKNIINKNIIQIGGNATIGKGFCRIELFQ
ncbi:MAG: type III-B CRISPR module RAMP protein Cmr4 [Leptospiraceae bacterium]|nr:MAG: type III-B CRISPR module RAMP protein Cmr4 [Leptospiraceae bacterium]